MQNNIFVEECSVRFGDIDRSDTLTVAAAFDFFQEAAINHAEILGVGRDAMKTTGQVWILSRMSVFMERRPRFGENITVRSWPRGTHKLFAVRDYDIRGADGKPAVRGRSGWLILDLEKRRPLRPQGVVEPLPLNDGLDSLPGAAAANEAPPGLRPEFEGVPSAPSSDPADRTNLTGPADPTDLSRTVRKACYSDIDYNGHMNNTRYIQWIQDLFAPEILETARSVRLDINYLSEVKPGERIELLLIPKTPADFARPGGYPDPLSAVFALEGRRDTEAVFRAELYTGD
ncbi:MAG: acyl-ACP thioesterase [Treponema sp.]|jgi:acyl-ACP thioesterase|nr:acyl-ACP thioesterase [Treponema sp.]